MTGYPGRWWLASLGDGDTHLGVWSGVTRSVHGRCGAEFQPVPLPSAGTFCPDHRPIRIRSALRAVPTPMPGDLLPDEVSMLSPEQAARVVLDIIPHRAKVRGEELTGLLEDWPTLFKLPTAGWFLLRALAYRLERSGETPRDQLLRIQLLKDRLLKVRVRRHWACLLRVLLQTYVVVIPTFVLSQLVSGDLWVVQSVLWYLAAAAVLRFAWKVLKWWSEVLVVTDKFFMITRGIIVKKTSMLPLTKVTDLSYLRTVGGRMLDYGTIRVEFAGQTQDIEKFEYLPSPEATFDVIWHLVFGENGCPGAPPRESNPLVALLTAWRRQCRGRFNP